MMALWAFHIGGGGGNQIDIIEMYQNLLSHVSDLVRHIETTFKQKSKTDDPKLYQNIFLSPFGERGKKSMCIYLTLLITKRRN